MLKCAHSSGGDRLSRTVSRAAFWLAAQKRVLPKHFSPPRLLPRGHCRGLEEANGHLHLVIRPYQAASVRIATSPSDRSGCHCDQVAQGRGAQLRRVGVSGPDDPNQVKPGQNIGGTDVLHEALALLAGEDVDFSQGGTAVEVTHHISPFSENDTVRLPATMM